jgi:hypothetical protein
MGKALKKERCVFWCKAYAIWPTRFYVVRRGVVEYKAEPNATHEYKLEHLQSFLQAC